MKTKTIYVKKQLPGTEVVIAYSEIKDLFDENRNVFGEIPRIYIGCDFEFIPITKSLNPPSWYIRAADLKSAVWQENKDRRLQGMVQLSPNEFTKFKYGISLKDYLLIEVSRLAYYNRKHK